MRTRQLQPALDVTAPPPTTCLVLQVKQLAGDIGIDRKQVLAWLKARAQQPDE